MPHPLFASRRQFLAGGSALVGASTLLPRAARAETAVAFQLSWLHSTQFAGSYIAQKNGWWAETGWM